jgi:3D (Asp-Asp-Asp) domain-containing protein
VTNARKGEFVEKGMRYFLTTIGFAFLIATPIFAAEDSLLARITVYWRAEGQLRACSNGARLRTGHCAVDPKRIPFGSQVLFPDTACVAVDSGPAVVSRKAARMTGRTVLQRNALVIDRFFESREAALAWERSHPHFMTVRVVRPGSRVETKTLVAEVPRNETRTTDFPKTNKLKPRITADGTELAAPANPLARTARRRAL